MALGEVETLLTALRENRPLLPRIRTPKHTQVGGFVSLEKVRP